MPPIHDARYAPDPSRERYSDWEPVSSSWLAAIRWVFAEDRDRRGHVVEHLEAEFLSGFRCRYPNKGHLFEAWLAAPSQGKWLHKNLISSDYIPL